MASKHERVQLNTSSHLVELRNCLAAKQQSALKHQSAKSTEVVVCTEPRVFIKLKQQNINNKQATCRDV